MSTSAQTLTVGWYRESYARDQSAVTAIVRGAGTPKGLAGWEIRPVDNDILEWSTVRNGNDILT